MRKLTSQLGVAICNFGIWFMDTIGLDQTWDASDYKHYRYLVKLRRDFLSRLNSEKGDVKCND